jgi:hypothetical protein
MATVSFSALIEDAQTQIHSAGYTADLWSPDSATRREDEEEALATPFPAQMFAALQCFQWFFTALADRRRAWVHLAAECQAGKTGAVTGLIRLVLANAPKIGITAQRIFVTTGMSDDAWKKQTRERLPHCLRENVHHNGSLQKVREQIARLASRDGGLRNILILIDESHIASSVGNRPNKMIYDAVRAYAPKPEEWAALNIRFLTISATDPAKVLTMETSEVPSQVVRLQTTDAYQSVQKLQDAGRLRPVEDFGDLHKEKALQELKRAVATYATPRYHVLRPRAGKQAEVMELLQREFPGCAVTGWDATRKQKKGDDGSSMTSFADINDLLSQAPEKHHFVLLKNMLYAAKTLDDTFVGVLWDRVGGKDDTNLQSLLGRACGYGKSKDTIVYASQQTVSNYIGFWKELCSNPAFSAELDVPAARVDKKMPGIKSDGTNDGGCIVRTTTTHATPFNTAVTTGGNSSEEEARPAREVANEDNFASEWREFATFEEARQWAPNVHTKKTDENGFYLTSTTAGARKLRYDEIIAMEGGKKTANLPWKALKVGHAVHRLYVGYKDEHDPTTAVFIVRKLTRNA